MKFAQLCQYFARIEATSKRLEKTDILVELLRQLKPEEVRIVVNLALGQLAAPYERLQFNLAEKMLVRVIAQAARESVEQIESEYARIGDIGELASSAVKQAATPKEYELNELYESLKKIALASGTGSQERKVRGLYDLLTVVSAIESKYIVRMVNESLRLGFSEATILDVLSTYAVGDKSYSERLKRVYQMRPDVALLASEVVSLGIEQVVSQARVELGVPVIPALAQRLGSTEEMIEKMGSVLVESKFDGTRVQIHFSTKKPAGNGDAQVSAQTGLFGEEKDEPKVWVKTFTRNLDESTSQFPELLLLGSQVRAESVILDAEAVGYDPKTGAQVPFQLTITRKRKHGVAEAQAAVPLKFHVFDIMYRDGETLIDKPLSERKKILKQVVGEGKVLVVDPWIETGSAQVIREFHAKQLSLGYEGVVVKKADGVYEPGRVGFNWVKLKEVENSEGKLSDTIDAVVMGYYRGRGKRSEFGLGAFLVGVGEPDGKIVTIAKIGTGLSDEQFRELYKSLNSIETTQPDSSYLVDKNMQPDVWVKPKVVVEVAADEVTRSPIHTAGYALRFPRLVRIREDKGLQEITTKEEVMKIAEIAVGLE